MVVDRCQVGRELRTSVLCARRRPDRRRMAMPPGLAYVAGHRIARPLGQDTLYRGTVEIRLRISRAHGRLHAALARRQGRGSVGGCIVAVTIGPRAGFGLGAFRALHFARQRNAVDQCAGFDSGAVPVFPVSGRHGPARREEFKIVQHRRPRHDGRYTSMREEREGQASSKQLGKGWGGDG